MIIGFGPYVALGGRANRYQTFDLNGILGTGQSLSVGLTGSPALSTTQPYANKMFVGGVRSLTSAAMASLVALVEGTDPALETHSSGMANLITSLARTYGGDHAALVAAHGVSSTAYAGLKKGTAPYVDGIEQATEGLARATALGQSFGVSAITCVHGESDHVDGTTRAQYLANLVEWRTDYETDIKAITGQKRPIPMFHSQINSYPGSSISLAMLDAHIAHTDIILVGPKYHLPYDADALHLTNHGYRQMGEEYARAYYHTVIRGQRWEPLRPKTVSIASNVITIVFRVPTAPLVFDTTALASVTNKGFDWTGAETITDVAITASDTVQITLSAAPAPGGRIRYAQLAASKGNLRDSDATASLQGYTLRNWCVHFDEAVS